MTIRQVAVVGAGVMGRGVTAALVRSGIEVTLVDLSTEILADARRGIRDDLRAATLLLGRPTLSTAESLALVTTVTDLDRVSTADLVIENVTERFDVKAPVHQALDRSCRPDVVIAVNTSAIRIKRLASLVSHPERVVGMHFMNPAAVKTTVEVIRGPASSPSAINAGVSFLRRIGKESVVVNASAGFVTNRVMMLTINEAILIAEQEVATCADIDRLFVECFGHRMGPLQTADLIGLDTVKLSLDVLLDDLKDERFRPASLLEQLVAEGRHGRKTGRGFFSYGSPAGAG